MRVYIQQVAEPETLVEALIRARRVQDVEIVHMMTGCAPTCA